MEIRNFKKSDAQELLRLIKSMVAYHQNLDSYYKPFSQYQNLDGEIQSWILDRNIKILVADQGDGLVGYGRFSIETAPTYAAVKKIGAVDDIFIEKPYRKQGMAKEIFKEALKWFQTKKVRNIELNVDSRNEAAIKFWKKLGFFDYKLRMRLDR